MFEVSVWEILTETCSGKQVFWNWQSKLLKNAYKEVQFKLHAPTADLLENEVFLNPTQQLYKK